MAATKEETFVLCGEVAKAFDVSTSTVSRWVKRGLIKSQVLRSGRKCINIFPISEIERIFNEMG